MDGRDYKRKGANVFVHSFRMAPQVFLEDDVKLRSPFGMIISGASSSGKTMLTLKLLSHCSEMISPSPKKILYCYGEFGEHIPALEKAGVITNEGPPTMEMLKSQPKPFLLVLDDLMMSINPTFLADIYTKKSHHMNFSVIFLTQNTFDPRLRVPRSNSQYLVLMRAPSSALAVRTLGSQLFPGRHNGFLEAYNDATSRQFGYLLVDMHPKSSDDLRLRTNIFPSDVMTIYKV